MEFLILNEKPSLFHGLLKPDTYVLAGFICTTYVSNAITLHRNTRFAPNFVDRFILIISFTDEF